MSPLTDNVFDPDQDAAQERAQRIRRMLIAGGATAAVGGGVVAATTLKHDDSLSFPDESSDKAIDKAIADADHNAAQHEPATPAAPHAVAAVPVEHTVTPVAHMGPSELADVKEVSGEVVDTAAPADPAAPVDPAAATPAVAGTPPAAVPPVAPPAQPIPAEQPVNDGQAPGTQPVSPPATDATVLHIDPQTGTVSINGSPVGSVEPAGGEITIDNEKTGLVYDPANGGRVVLPNGDAVPLHDGSFGISIDGDTVTVSEVGGEGTTPADGTTPDDGSAIPGTEAPAADLDPNAPADGTTPAADGTIPGADPSEGQGIAPGGQPGFDAGGQPLSDVTLDDATPATAVAGASGPGEDLGAPPPPVSDPDSTPGSVLGVGPEAIDAGSTGDAGAPPAAATDPNATPGSVVAVAPAANDELSFPDDAPPPPPVADSDTTTPPPTAGTSSGGDDGPPAPPAGDPGHGDDVAPHMGGSDAPPPPPVAHDVAPPPPPTPDAPPPPAPVAHDVAPPPPPTPDAPPPPDPAPHYDAAPAPPPPPPPPAPEPPAPEPPHDPMPAADADGDPSTY